MPEEFLVPVTPERNFFSNDTSREFEIFQLGKVFEVFRKFENDTCKKCQNIYTFPELAKFMPLRLQQKRAGSRSGAERVKNIGGHTFSKNAH